MNSIISIRVRMVGMPAVRAFIYVIEKCNRMLQRKRKIIRRIATR